MKTVGYIAVVAGVAAAILVMFYCFGSQEPSDPTHGQSPRGQQAGESSRYLKICPLANGFVFPVGPPDAQGYYNAQPFGKNNHLGEDWNGTGGGNTDLGDPVYAIAKGIVFHAKQAGPGWGNVVRVYHNIGTRDEPRFIESLYGHLDTLDVSEGDIVAKGQRLGTMGNVGGRYLAHLHLELRTRIGMPIGGGYSPRREGFVEPTGFIRSRRNIKRDAKQSPQRPHADAHR